MNKFHLTLALLGLAIAGRFAAAQPLIVRHEGWTIAAIPEKGTLRIAYDRLGPLLEDVQLHLNGKGCLEMCNGWSVEKQGEDRLSIKTGQPVSGWKFVLRRNLLTISCTSSTGVLTASAPAPKDRMVARLLDPSGVPVDWAGTTEVRMNFGGPETHNASFLPRRNPEVMYLGMGQVSASVFHSLFDRKSDTAINFPEETVLRRNPRDADLLDVTLPVPGNALLRVIPDYFTKSLGVPYYVPFDDAHFHTAPMVWSSWGSYYDAVTEKDIVANTDWLAEHLKPYGFQYVQLDEGFEPTRSNHYWIENWDPNKFPHGPKWLANYIKSKGLHAGLWLVPNAYAGAVEQHPDWYLRDKEGKVILDYRTPALDCTNPAVLSFLRKLFTTLNEWGFEYYKFDGEHALPGYVPSVDTSKLYDRSIDPLVAYRNRLKVIREAIGPRTFVEGCPAGTPLNGIGYFDSYFNGIDVYRSWQGMYGLLSSLYANAFLNRTVVYVMPGEGVEIGPPMTVEEAAKRRCPVLLEVAKDRENPLVGFGTTTAEARTLVTHVALTGVVYPLASVMPEVPDERIRLLKSTLPTLPIVPLDLFSRGTNADWGIFKRERPDYYIHNYPEILDLKVNAASGIYDVAAVTNWRSEKTTRTLSLPEKLGLDRDLPCLVFDYWNQKLLGVFKDRITVEVEPHDTRVLLIHRQLNRPQLVGISRHISGAYSVLDLAWDSATQTMRGSSESVPGDAYTLWLHVPEGFGVSHVRAKTRNNIAVDVQHALTNELLSITFVGQREPVDWEVAFTYDSANASAVDFDGSMTCFCHRSSDSFPRCVMLRQSSTLLSW